MADKGELIASKRDREIKEFKKSWFYSEVIKKIKEKIATTKTTLVGARELEAVYRSQGAVRALEYVLRIPEELEREVNNG